MYIGVWGADGVQVVGLAPAALVVQRVAFKQDMPQPDPKDKMIKSLPKVVHDIMLRLNVYTCTYIHIYMHIYTKRTHSHMQTHTIHIHMLRLNRAARSILVSELFTLTPKP